jgi:hypothetical protein
MKTILFAFFTCLYLSSCVKDIELQALNQTPSPSIQDGTKEAEGIFINGVHQVSGSVKLISDSQDPQKKYLSFQQFNTEQGPDLYIYLSEDTRPSNAISVAKLGNTGTFSLEIPNGSITAKHQYVLVWCKQFSVLFGSAKLAK